MNAAMNQVRQEFLQQFSHITTSIFFMKLPQIVAGLLVFLTFYFFSLIAKKLIMRLATNGSKQHFYVYNLFGKLAKVGLLLFGLISSLGTMGVNVSALVAGLGLTGFALGFALKDVLANVLSGILIMLYRPFKPRHEITVTNFTGTVKSIDLRYTTLANDDAIILIPNSTMLTNPVKIHKS